MNLWLRKLSPGAGRGIGISLMLVLVLVVVAPSVCLVWFMSRAAQNERLAVRQKLEDAYRVHLSLAQERLTAFYHEIGAQLDARAATNPGPVLFAKLVGEGLAESAVCFDQNGRITYPTRPEPRFEPEPPGWAEAERRELAAPEAAAAAFAGIATETADPNVAARAYQAQARCLIRAGKSDAALAVLLGPLGEQRYADAADAEGRLVVPNAELIALELLRESDSARSVQLRDKLVRRVNDYDAPMPSSQRRFLMRQLGELSNAHASFSTLAAEDLAAQVVEAQPPPIGSAGLHPSPLPGIWEWASPSGRVVLLYHTDSLAAKLRSAIAAPSLPRDATVVLVPPGSDYEKYFTTLPAGLEWPGWRIGLDLQDKSLFETAANQRIASDIWIGVLVIGAASALALLAVQLVRRQMALTRLRNDLVANVTHELKTPISSTRLLVDTLLDSPRLPQTTIREYLELIARENLRLSRLIDNFLAFSRMERNKYAFDFQAVPAKQIVDEAAAAVRERLNSPGCQFDVSAPADLPEVTADPGAMVTALVNLLENAYKYSHEEKHISLRAVSQNGHVSFLVQDNGIGLAPRDARRVFKRFYQVTPGGGGCGLGLSIVEFIVRAHHGEVKVDSQPGRGSTFTITLPQARHAERKES